MIEKLVISIVKLQIGIGTIEKDDMKVYHYGYTLVIELLLNIVLSLILSVLLGKFKEYIFFLCMFIPLRSFCGGYHAKNAWLCVVLSNFSIILVLLLAEMITHYNISLITCIAGEICLSIVIAYLSPVECDNRELNRLESRVYKIKASTILMIQLLLGIVLLILGYRKLFNLLLGTHIILLLGLLMACTKIRNKLFGRNCNVEQEN